jgi:hypothetical protein
MADATRPDMAIRNIPEFNSLHLVYINFLVLCNANPDQLWEQTSDCSS